MRVRELAVEGSFEFSIPRFPDDRGFFVSPFLGSAFTETCGWAPFPLAQSSFSMSRAGVARGMHYTATPPGNAKYVYCANGKALDIVLDIRVGSPTFGRWDTVVLDPAEPRAVYFPIGVAHGFVAQADDTIMTYLMTGEYVQENELALDLLDRELRLPVPAESAPLLSERDRVAPTLAEARSAGLLPHYEQCREIEAAFGTRSPHPPTIGTPQSRRRAS
jgi:epimerase EvaD